jgi:hypothetical protein
MGKMDRGVAFMGMVMRKITPAPAMKTWGNGYAVTFLTSALD